MEPHCLVLRDSSGSHVLAFATESLRPTAKVGANVTLTGRSNPKMMSTCMQGPVFVVTAISPN